MTKREIFDNCTISITHLNITYSFEKPKNFECELLKVRIDRYHNIIALVVDEYGSSLAICYSTNGFVYDGRDGFEKYTLVPTNYKDFFNNLEGEKENASN